MHVRKTSLLQSESSPYSILIGVGEWGKKLISTHSLTH